MKSVFGIARVWTIRDVVVALADGASPLHGIGLALWAGALVVIETEHVTTVGARVITSATADVSLGSCHDRDPHLLVGLSSSAYK